MMIEAFDEAQTELDALALALEQVRQNAMLERDVDTLAALLAPELVYVHSNGVLDTRERYLASLASGANIYRSLALEQVQVHAASETLRMVTGWMIATIQKPTGDVALRARYVAVWRKQGTDWLLTFFQGTKSTEPGKELGKP